MDLMNNNDALFIEISTLIEQTRRAIYAQTSGSVVLLFWKIGQRINNDILKNKRADYGKQIVSQLATQLSEKYGRSFELRNLRRMMQFAEQFTDFSIVSPSATQLSWAHIVEVLPLKTQDARIFYMEEAARGLISRDKLRELINRKVYERKEIANTQITDTVRIPHNVFRDPYLFDILGIKDEYLESDLEAAVLRELEKFILEFGKGFAFVERQKRMIIDGADHTVDLLFYNRYMKRLVAIDLKQGQFDAAFSGEMKLYLKWLNRYDRQEGENEPIGLILCASGHHREKIELLEMDKDGIMVAEYWTNLPPKAEFEKKIQAILVETRERLMQRKLLLPEKENDLKN